MIICVSGLPGEGKSYYMSKAIIDAQKRGRMVFSNYPMPGTYVLKFEDFMDKMFPEGSLLCVDEANSWFRNRDWQKFTKEMFAFFMHHRHFKLDMILIAQSPTTLDVNIRDIVSNWIWSSAYISLFQKTKDGQPKALWFKWSSYISIEDMAADRNCYKRRRVIASQKIFKKFDSYYKFVELQREPIELRRWEFEV